MSDHRDNEYPTNWHAGGGEANRPLHDRGYYQHRYYRVLPGSNQHVERFLEIVVDTEDLPPSRHHVALEYCAEDSDEVCRQKRLDHDTVEVDGREDPQAQQEAEQEAHSLAERMMSEYAEWTP